jgi:hypothetical protein
MALIKSLLNATLEQQQQAFSDSLAFCDALKDELEVGYYAPPNAPYYIAFYPKNTASKSDGNYLFGFKFGGGAYGQVCCRASDGQSATGEFVADTRHNDTVFKIVATKLGIAIVKATGTTTYTAGIVSLDNTGSVTAIIKGGTLENPQVVPRSEQYIATNYPATTTTAFGCTALSKIPVPTYDGNAKYLPSVSFAHATQYQIDGSVLLNGTQKFYCIGGSWFLDDSEGVLT